MLTSGKRLGKFDRTNFSLPGAPGGRRPALQLSPFLFRTPFINFSGMRPEGAAPGRLRELRDEVKRRIDYRSFYARYCPEARASGSRLHGFCPIPSHAHTGKGHPSLSVDLQQGLFNCFSRGEGGDAITFYELMHGVTFSRAVRELARDLGLDGRKGRPSLASRAAPDPAESDSETEEHLSPEQVAEVCTRFIEVCRAEDQLEGRAYLARRGIDAQTARRASVTYFPRRAYRRVMRRMLEGFNVETLRRAGTTCAAQSLRSTTRTRSPASRAAGSSTSSRASRTRSRSSRTASTPSGSWARAGSRRSGSRRSPRSPSWPRSNPTPPGAAPPRATVSFSPRAASRSPRS